MKVDFDYMIKVLELIHEGHDYTIEHTEGDDTAFIIVDNPDFYSNQDKGADPKFVLEVKVNE